MLSYSSKSKTNLKSSGSKNKMFVPSLPIRPVLPDLWTKLSICLHPHWITTSISSMSRPLDATSVATNILLEFFSLYRFRRVSLWDYSKSPCKVKNSIRKLFKGYSLLAYVIFSNSFAIFLVSVKIMIFFFLFFSI